MNKLIYAIGLVLLSAAVKVNTLQCYQCYNCTKVTDSDLVTCGATTTTTSTRTPGTDTPSTVTQATTPSTGTPATATPSTDTPATATPSTDTPATATPSTVTPATVQPVTDTPATVAPSTVTPATVEPVTDTPATVAPSTVAPATVTPATLTPAPETPATDAPVTDPAELGIGQSDNAPISGSNIFVTRVRRAADEVQVKADKYVCGSITEKVNDVDVVVRSCLLETGDSETCQNNNMNSTCKTCATDKCNSAVSLQFSVVTLMFLFFWSIV